MSDAAHAGHANGVLLAPRERAVIIAALVGVSVIAWLYLWRLASGPGTMGASTAGAIGTVLAPWPAATFPLMFAMWWTMMLGMMLPGATPMILTFATMNARKRARGRPFVPTAAFVAGYLVAWGVFSVIATLAQAALDRAALMSPSMRVGSALLGGLLLITAGAYQLTPLKQACLGKCRAPVDFVINHWREGRLGAFRMGIAHGVFCLGCCAVLMTLLFVGGVMSLPWVAGIAAFILVEKLFPAGERIAHIGGALLIGAGAYLILSG